MIFQIEHTPPDDGPLAPGRNPERGRGKPLLPNLVRRYIMEYFETAAYAHTRLRESIEDSLLELSSRLEQRSQIEENATWAQVADLRRLNNLLEQALEFFKGND